MSALVPRRKIHPLYAVVMSVLAVLAASCASMSEEETAEPASREPAPCPSEYPPWYCEPLGYEGHLTGVGSANFPSAHTNREMAASRARREIAFQKQSLMQAAITDYFQGAGEIVGNQRPQVIEFSESVSREIADVNLSNSKIAKVFISPDKTTTFVLVVYGFDSFRDDAEQVLSRYEGNFARREDAAFAEFKADEALKYLDKQLEDNQQHLRTLITPESS